MTTICKAIFTFDPQPPPPSCGAETSGIVTVVASGGASGFYWNIATGTNNHPFTNPSAFALNQGDFICVNAGGEVVSSIPCEIKAQVLIDNVPVSNKFPACDFIPIPLLQIFATNAIINPGVTFKLIDMGTFLQGEVTIYSGSSHMLAQLTVFFNDVPAFMFEAPFTCSIRRRNPRRRAVSYAQPQLCFPNPSNAVCPPTIRSGGYLYEFTGKDASGNCCYTLRR